MKLEHIFFCDCVCFDIVELNYYKKYNKGYRFILVIQDIYSRRIFLRALQNKIAAETLKIIKNVEKEFLDKGYKIHNIIADFGKEFNNKLFLNHFENIKDKIKYS